MGVRQTKKAVNHYSRVRKNSTIDREHIRLREQDDHREQKAISYHHSQSVKPQIYLLFSVQPCDDSFGIHKLQPKVPNLTQSDGPGNLRQREEQRHVSRGSPPLPPSLLLHSFSSFINLTRTNLWTRGHFTAGLCKHCSLTYDNITMNS